MSGEKGFKGTPWLVEIIEPDYLDGILSGVTVYGNERRPIAYAFDEAEGRLLAGAPELLEALVEAEELLMRTLRWSEGWECSEEDLLGGIRAAIAKALGEDQ